MARETLMEQLNLQVPAQWILTPRMTVPNCLELCSSQQNLVLSARVALWQWSKRSLALL